MTEYGLIAAGIALALLAALPFGDSLAHGLALIACHMDSSPVCVLP